MKKLISALLACACSIAFGATLNPVQLLNPSGSTSGQAIVSTGASSAPAWSTITASLPQIAANTILANATGALASPTAVSMPGCSATGSALNWTSDSGGVTCQTGLATTASVALGKPCPSILDYGGNNGGSVDNTAAFASAAAAAPARQACVYFPPGAYAFSSNVAYTVPFPSGGITILGAGADASELVWAGGGGLAINLKSQFNYVHIRDLSILTGATNTGSGINIGQTASSIANPAVTAPSDITNVTIRGLDGYALTDYWQVGIQVVGVSNINFNGVNVFGASTAAGTGLYIWGSSSLIPVVFNLNYSAFDQLNVGFEYGTYVQGVTVNACNFTQDNYGVDVPSGEANIDQLSIVNSQFNDYDDGINIATSLEGTQIANSTFIVYNNSQGIDLDSTSSTSITGSIFQPQVTSPTSATGIVFGTYNGANSIVTGNMFYSLTTGV